MRLPFKRRVTSAPFYSPCSGKKRSRGRQDLSASICNPVRSGRVIGFIAARCATGSSHVKNRLLVSCSRFLLADPLSSPLARGLMPIFTAAPHENPGPSGESRRSRAIRNALLRNYSPADFRSQGPTIRPTSGHGLVNRRTKTRGEVEAPEFFRKGFHGPVDGETDGHFRGALGKLPKWH